MRLAKYAWIAAAWVWLNLFVQVTAGISPLGVIFQLFAEAVR